VRPFGHHRLENGQIAAFDKVRIALVKADNEYMVDIGQIGRKRCRKDPDPSQHQNGVKSPFRVCHFVFLTLVGESYSQGDVQKIAVHDTTGKPHPASS
jgi:hypothetical protein